MRYLHSARFIFPEIYRDHNHRIVSLFLTIQTAKEEAAETEFRTLDLIHDPRRNSALDRSTTVGRLNINCLLCSWHL